MGTKPKLCQKCKTYKGMALGAWGHEIYICNKCFDEWVQFSEICPLKEFHCASWAGWDDQDSSGRKWHQGAWLAAFNTFCYGTSSRYKGIAWDVNKMKWATNVNGQAALFEHELEAWEAIK